MAVLRVDGLTKRFGSFVAVREVGFEVGPGSLFGLLGPNGSGKTTTLACALGLLVPDAGHAEVLGTPSARIDRTAGRVGVVFDRASLLSGLTARENLDYARRLLGHVGGRDPDDALALVELGALAGRRAGRLSLGQQRRLAIARALLGEPELLVLDEPLSGLDPVGVGRMLALFRRLREDGLTLVLSSHRLHEMEQVVDHVAMLVRGGLVRCGTLADLLGERRGLVRFVAEPRERAREALAAALGAGAVTDDGDALVAAGGADGPAPLVAALVGAGCAVRAVEPVRATLAAAFDAALAEASPR